MLVKHLNHLNLLAEAQPIQVGRSWKTRWVSGWSSQSIVPTQLLVGSSMPLRMHSRRPLQMPAIFLKATWTRTTSTSCRRESWFFHNAAAWLWMGMERRQNETQERRTKGTNNNKHQPNSNQTTVTSNSCWTNFGQTNAPLHPFREKPSLLVSTLFRPRGSCTRLRVVPSTWSSASPLRTGAPKRSGLPDRRPGRGSFPDVT